ncbi:hypothetical protein T08_14764 [Trichinella sp. T8]|nr:hypothetical protein T08_14764 [Trichinella sp. T8]
MQALHHSFLDFILVATVLKLEVIIFGIVFGTNIEMLFKINKQAILLYQSVHCMGYWDFTIILLKHEHGVIFRKNLATMNITVMN